MPFIVMERSPGDTLGDQIALGPLSQVRVRDVLSDVLAALAAAHDAEILHRDIKPGNILLAASGGVKLADFGTVKTAASVHTTTGDVLGTLADLSPARITGEPVSAADDLYAVGVVGYEALTGDKPFAHDEIMPLARAILAGRPTPLAELRPDVDAGLIDVIERAMSQDPSRRFRSADEMRGALTSSRQHSTPGSVRSVRESARSLPVAAGSVRSPRRPVKRAPRLVGSAAFVGVAAAMALPFVLEAPPTAPASESDTLRMSTPAPTPIVVTAPPALVEHVAAEPVAVGLPAPPAVVERLTRREPDTAGDSGVADLRSDVTTTRYRAGGRGGGDTIESAPSGDTKAGGDSAKGNDGNNGNGNRKNGSSNNKGSGNGNNGNGSGNNGNGRPR